MVKYRSIIHLSRGGGTGIRARLKILWLNRAVWVRVPPAALISFMPLDGSRYHSRSCGIAESHPRHTRGVAQLVECALWEREAAGSSPATPTRQS